MIKKIHFANLNTLRFIAAFLVVIAHTEQIKMAKGLPNIYNIPFVEIMGSLSVDLFFVLSGFLITSLLFIEKETPSGISIKKFIIRRLLRIWPLYFIIMILGFFIMPQFQDLKIGSPFVNVHDDFASNIILYVLFLPHIQSIIIGPILYCVQAWSIGIEEQFYIFWPFVVKKFNQRKIVVFIIAFTVAYLLICVFLSFATHNQTLINKFSFNTLFNTNIIFRHRLKFDCLLIGALFAIVHTKINDESFILNKYFQIFIYLLEVVLLISGNDFHGFFWEIHAVLYGFIILNLVRTKTSIFNIDYPVFDYLGKISYGVYMYHVLIINLVLTFLYKVDLLIVAYPIIFILVILISGLSYRFIEGYFLTKKKDFSVISTG
ncbi:acyltransferase [Flavobacterium sp. KJJ]|uniref:acyltransferase family protein n=1 Tax=Flavobacterium sp. KJJ TaxID=1270193 RepID=UPI0004930B48|nr:acyltransferase [Flavobacterium sp. KJJ]